MSHHATAYEAAAAAAEAWKRAHPLGVGAEQEEGQGNVGTIGGAVAAAAVAAATAEGNDDAMAAATANADNVDSSAAAAAAAVAEAGNAAALLAAAAGAADALAGGCLLYTSPSPRDRQKSRMPSSA